MEILVNSIAGEKERKLPDLLLKYLQFEKREFVRDWMKGYINLENIDGDFRFWVDGRRISDKDIRVEYLGTFDGMGTMMEDRTIEWKTGCGEKLFDFSASRMDIVF